MLFQIDLTVLLRLLSQDIKEQAEAALTAPVLGSTMAGAAGWLTGWAVRPMGTGRQEGEAAAPDRGRISSESTGGDTAFARSQQQRFGECPPSLRGSLCHCHLLYRRANHETGSELSLIHETGPSEVTP